MRDIDREREREGVCVCERGREREREREREKARERNRVRAYVEIHFDQFSLPLWLRLFISQEMGDSCVRRQWHEERDQLCPVKLLLSLGHSAPQSELGEVCSHQARIATHFTPPEGPFCYLAVSHHTLNTK